MLSPMLWHFLLMVSCWPQKVSNFEAFQILEYWIRDAQLAFEIIFLLECPSGGGEFAVLFIQGPVSQNHDGHWSPSFLSPLHQSKHKAAKTWEGKGGVRGRAECTFLVQEFSIKVSPFPCTPMLSQTSSQPNVFDNIKRSLRPLHVFFWQQIPRLLI